MSVNIYFCPELRYEKNKTDMNKTIYPLLAFICIFNFTSLQAQIEADTLDEVASMVESTQIIDDALEISHLDTTGETSIYNLNSNGVLLLKDSPIVRELDSLTFNKFYQDFYFLKGLWQKSKESLDINY